MPVPVYRDLGAALSRDYKATDQLQTVTYTRVRSEGGNLAIQITHADFSQVTERQSASLGGAFQAGNGHWFLGADQFAAAGFEPTQGDLIVDKDGVLWTVTGDCTLDELRISWEVFTTKGR